MPCNLWWALWVFLVQDNDSYEVVPGSEFVLTRVAFRDNSSKYYLDNRTSTFTEVTKLLMGKGVDLEHNRFLILQVSHGFNHQSTGESISFNFFRNLSQFRSVNHTHWLLLGGSSSLQNLLLAHIRGSNSGNIRDYVERFWSTFCLIMSTLSNDLVNLFFFVLWSNNCIDKLSPEWNQFFSFQKRS